jgi:hypothetical protein
MKMSYCLIHASRALLIGLGYVAFEVAVRCSLIAQRAPVWKREP